MANKKATLYRMKLPTHECPFGLRAKQMLEEAGFEVDDRLLTSREETDAFKAKHNLTTTPLIFIDDEPIGGSDALEEYLESANS